MNKCKFDFFALLFVLCLTLGCCGPCINEKVVTELKSFSGIIELILLINSLYLLYVSVVLSNFLDKVDILTTALAGAVWDKITKKEYFDTLRIEGGISQAEIDYLVDLGVLNKPKFKGEN